MRSALFRLAKKSVQESLKSGRIDAKLVNEQVDRIKNYKATERLALLRAYKRLITAKLMTQSATIKSAIDLNNAEKQVLVRLIEKRYGKKFINFETNEKLLAGLEVKIGDDVFDYSLQGKMNKIQEAFA